jgi:hypothetical protein
MIYTQVLAMKIKSERGDSIMRMMYFKYDKEGNINQKEFYKDGKNKVICKFIVI